MLDILLLAPIYLILCAVAVYAVVAVVNYVDQTRLELLQRRRFKKVEGLTR